MKLLYAEDEKPLSMAVTEILKMEHYEVDAVWDGTEALNHLQTNSYDIVILDIMMPKMDGIAVLKEMRRQNDFTPVMLLTAKAELDDRITGFRVGADDYLGKPFSTAELIVRLNAILRRSIRYKTIPKSLGNISLDCESCELTSDTGSLILSSRETELLSLFLTHKSGTFSTKQIQKEIFREEGDENIVMLYISYLQNKLKQLKSTVTIVKSDSRYSLAVSGGGSL